MGSEQAIIIFNDIIRGYDHIGFAMLGGMSEEQWTLSVKEWFRQHKELTVWGVTYKKVSDLLDCLEYRAVSKSEVEAINNCFGDLMTDGMFGTFPDQLFDKEDDDE